MSYEEDKWRRQAAEMERGQEAGGALLILIKHPVFLLKNLGKGMSSIVYLHKQGQKRKMRGGMKRGKKMLLSS